LEVLWCDNHVLAIQKPAGLPSVPDESGDESALDLARAWVKQEYNKPGDVFLGVVHRLDRPVSGVLCFGRTSKGAARLTEALRERRVQKTYLGVVQGELTGEGFLEQSLLKDSSRNRVNWTPLPGVPINCGWLAQPSVPPCLGTSSTAPKWLFQIEALLCTACVS